MPLAGGLLEACGSSSSAAGGSGSGGSSKGIVVGLATDIDTLDPISFRSDAAYEAVMQVYEMPVDNPVSRQDGILEGTAGSLIPELASTYSISPDATVYRFTVRRGVKFTSGNPVNADALHYSYLRALKGPGYASSLMSLLTVTDPSQLVVTGPMTFEIHLSRPNPLGPKLIPLTVLEVMDPTVSKQHATASDPWAASFYRTNMVGTGPYTQGTTWQSGSQYLLSPNPHYWNPGKVKNGGILMKYLPSADDRALLLQQGSIDLAFSLPASKLNSLRGSKGVQLINVPSRNWNYLGMNNAVAPFNDVKVRQAIAYALPYETLINGALHGFASPLKGILASSTPTASDSSWPYKTDINKAKQLLSESSHPHGFQTTLAVQVSKSNDLDAATYIQSALRQIGISVSITQESSAAFATKVDSGELPMFIDYWFSWVDDPFYQMYWLLSSKNAASGGTNVAKYSNPQVDSLIGSGIYDTDAARRASTSQQVQQLFNSDVPYVPLYSENNALAAGSGVSGINVFPDQYVRFWMLSKG